MYLEKQNESLVESEAIWFGVYVHKQPLHLAHRREEDPKRKDERCIKRCNKPHRVV